MIFTRISYVSIKPIDGRKTFNKKKEMHSSTTGLTNTGFMIMLTLRIRYRASTSAGMLGWSSRVRLLRTTSGNDGTFEERIYRRKAR